MLITQTLDKALKLYPNKKAIVCEEVEITYAEFARRVNQLSHALLGMGVAKGDRVAILHWNCHVYLETYYATAQIGAVLVPLNVRLSPSELVYILENSGSCYVIAQREFSNLIRNILNNTKIVKKIIWTGPLIGTDTQNGQDYEELLREYSVEKPPDSKLDENNLVNIYYTSGTTGRAKGVMLTHKNLYIHALGTIAELNIKDTDSWYHVVPMFHLADVWSTWAITWVGGKHVLLRRFDTKKVLSTIEKQKITITNLIPTMFNLLLNDPDVNKYDYSSLRLLMSGGSHIAPKLVNKILQTFKCEYIQTYGMTETSPYLTFSLIKDHLLTEPPDKITEIRCTTGREFITVDLKVVRENGEEVNADNQEVGEIIVRGDTITPGYWQLPEETGKTIRDGWLYTGDLAVVNEEQYITIVDRKKDMIITGGENVYSTEVENILYMHPGILEVAVIGVPDEKWGETIKAFVVLKKDQSTTEDEIISFCRQYLAGYKIPRSIEILLELPKTGSGKIYKNILRETYWPSGKVQVR